MTEPIISTIFPTTIYSIDLNRSIEDDEKNFVIETGKNVKRNTSNYISIDRDVLQDVKLNKIKNFINENLQKYLNDIYKPKHNLCLKITESWLNYTNQNEKHHRHHHPNSIISGVFYFNCLDNDSIIFYNKLQYSSTFEIEAKEFTMLNSMSWTFPVKTGTLILFPSYIEHEVNENQNNIPKTRISLSFNTMLSGQISTLPSKRVSI